VGGRISRGWRLAKASLSVVRRDPALAGLAAIGGILALVLAIGPFIGGAVAVESDSTGVRYLGYALLAVGLYLANFAVVFSGVAIALAAARVLDGEDATVGDGLRGAMARIGPIFQWAIVGATINILFTILRDRLGAAGAILAGIGSAAWSLVTFLAVPVVAFEGLGPIATLKRSAGLFRQRWGEQITGTVSIGFVFFVVSLPAIALVVVGIASGIFPLAILGGLILVAIMMVSRAASSTFGVALYRYAATGEVSGPFAESDIAGIATKAA
jgi:hypothetical protein